MDCCIKCSINTKTLISCPLDDSVRNSHFLRLLLQPRPSGWWILYHRSTCQTENDWLCDWLAAWLPSGFSICKLIPNLAVVEPHHTTPCEHQTPYVHDTGPNTRIQRLLLKHTHMHTHTQRVRASPYAHKAQTNQSQTHKPKLDSDLSVTDKLRIQSLHDLWS